MFVSSKLFGSLIVGVAWTLSISNAIAYRKDPPAWSLNKAQLAYEFSSVEQPKGGSPYVTYNDQGPSYQTDQNTVYREQPRFVPLIQPARNTYSAPQPGPYLSAPSANAFGDSYSNSKPTGIHTVYPFRPGQVLPAENEVSSPKDNYGPPQSAPAPTHYYGAPKHPSVTPPSGEYGTPNKAPSDTYGLPNKAPSDEYGLPNKAPADTYGLPNKAPSDTYGLPQTQALAEPPKSYGTPTNAPSSSYGPPSTSYGTPSNPPSESYGPPSSSYSVQSHPPSDSYGPPAEGGYSSPPSSGEYGAPYPHPHPSENREVRFLIHKAGDEEIVKDAVIEDAKWSGDKISFVHGPNLEVKHHQKVYLPPQKKSIIYVLLKEPEIKTTIEVNEPAEAEQPKPEVFIIYQTGNGVIKKHYDLSPEEGSKVAQVLANKLRQARQTGKTESAAEKAEDAELKKIEEMLTSTAKPTAEPEEGESTTQVDTVMCKTN